MKVKNIIFSTGIALSAILGVSSTAKAGTFTTNFSPLNPDPKGNISLDSIIRGTDGETVSDFKFVTSVNIIQNNDALFGPASTDRGDTATSPSDPNETPTGAEIASFLGNNNLNNIVDSEDSGSFIFDAFFSSSVISDNLEKESFYFWERGSNSKLQVQAILEDGTIGAAETIEIGDWTPAGFSIDTEEVNAAQGVGSFALTFGKLGLTTSSRVAGLRLTSLSSFNGPDFKFVAADVIDRTVVPEPTTMLGLGSVAALALFRRRQTKKSAV